MSSKNIKPPTDKPVHSKKFTTQKTMNKQLKISIAEKLNEDSPNVDLNLKYRKESDPILCYKTPNKDNFTLKIIDNGTDSHHKKVKPFSLNPKKTEEKNHLDLNILKKAYNDWTECQASQKPFNVVKSFAYNAYKGLMKETNEDKVMVIDHIKKPADSKNRIWPKLSYFGIFDGHGGETCSTFLKDNLHEFIKKDKNFPMDIKAAILGGFEKAEEEFAKKYTVSDVADIEKMDQSGSCACVVIIADTKIYVANVGDSRCILSMDGGTKVKPLSIDHKPNNPNEYQRIIKSGGKIYLDEDENVRDVEKFRFINDIKEFDTIPDALQETIYRVYPFDLAVSRTLGDIRCKNSQFGGVPGAISSVPEIVVTEWSNTYDFIVIGCDGIYDELDNCDVVDSVWYVVKKVMKEKNYDLNLITKDACDMVIKNSMDKLSGDNLSCIIIGLDGLEKFVHEKSIKDKVGQRLNNEKKGK